MVRSKAQSKKQQKGGVDFKKIKRKIGRKLPPPKNATNTEVKFKAIILPEQSVAAEKEGLAVDKKGLTLKELLQRTSHFNSKVRRDALLGIKVVLNKHPAELKLHKYVVIEKLRERIGDDDKVVRETLYQLLKSVVFPGCKEDNEWLSSLLMAYIFNAMTHFSIEIRLMAFKFLEIVLQYNPPSFFFYAERILQNYEEILQKNHICLQDQSKLKTVLAGLVHCMSLLPCNKREVLSSDDDDVGRKVPSAWELIDSTGRSTINKRLKDLLPVLVGCFQGFVRVVKNTAHLDGQSFHCMLYILQCLDHIVGFFLYVNKEGGSGLRPPWGRPDLKWDGTISLLLLKKLFSVFPLNPVHDLPEKDNDKYFVVNILLTEIFLYSTECVSVPDVLLEIFLEFIEKDLLGMNWNDSRPGKRPWEKHALSLLQFIPKLVKQVASFWKLRLLQAFTTAFKDSRPDSSFKLACLSAIEKMLLPIHDMFLDPNNLELLEHQVAWIREIPSLLMLLGDKNATYLRVVLKLMHRLGQYASPKYYPSLRWEYENLQIPLQEFFCVQRGDGSIHYGPFVSLARESQELSINSLYYFSNLDSLLLKSITQCCCTCPDLDPGVVIRLVHVLHSAYRDGHIDISHQLSFFVTLLSRYKVLHVKNSSDVESNGKTSNRQAFMEITRITCPYLSRMGDGFLLLQILEKFILDEISLKRPLDNACALLRMLVELDSEPSRLSGQTILTLSNFLPGYLIDMVHSIPKDTDATVADRFLACWFYLYPCFYLFERSPKLLNLVLEAMASFNAESSFWGFSHNFTSISISSRTNAIISVIVVLNEDPKFRTIMASFKSEIDRILQEILSLQSSAQISMTTEDKHRVQYAVDQLKNVRCQLPDVAKRS